MALMFIKDIEAAHEAEKRARAELESVMPWRWPGVYVMASEGGGSIKVGHSKNPVRRLNDLQVSNQDTLRVFWVLRAKGDGAKKIERAFHNAARKTPHHLRGEWYCIKPEIAVSVIKKIAIKLNIETCADLQFGYERGL